MATIDHHYIECGDVYPRKWISFMRLHIGKVGSMERVRQGKVFRDCILQTEDREVREERYETTQQMHKSDRDAFYTVSPIWKQQSVVRKSGCLFI